MPTSDPTPLQRLFAAIGLVAFITVVLLDGLPWYTANEYLSGMLMIIVLACAGFAGLIQVWIETR